MKPSRLLFVAVLFAGLAAAATFHASGALSDADARLAVAARDGSLATWPPSPISSRVFHLGVVLVRLVWAPTGLFRALHLTAGLLLALAAAASAIVAFRLGADRRATGLAAAVLVGASMLFGRDLAGLGLAAQPVSVLLLLLAGCAWAWTGATPRAALGGFFLGLAVAEHPLVLFLLPGFGAFALQATLRVAPEGDAGVLRRIALGFLAGFAAVFLPILDASNTGLLHVATPHSPLAALAAWARSPHGAFWSITGPRHWGEGVVRLAHVLWRNAGPVGVLLGLAGIGSFFAGAARLARPFLIVHALLALAIVFGRPADAGTAAVLAGWSFLFWTTPALADLEGRLAARRGSDLSHAAVVTPLVAAVASAALLALNGRSIDRAAEKGVTWTSTVLDTLPPDSILLTRNPVALALAADGRRPDVDVVHLDEPSTLTAFRTGRLLLPLGETPPARVDPEVLRTLLAASEGARGIFLDPSVYFAVDRRTELLGKDWIAVPHGLAFRVAEVGWKPSNDERQAAALAWDGVNVTPDTPASPLRDGLRGSAYFARSLVQSAYLHLEQERGDDAEREFLIALGHPGVNRTLAALGYARLLHQRRNWREVAATLESYVRDDDEGAWVARRFLGATYVRLGDRRRALLALQRALRLAPASLASERAAIQREIREISARPDAATAPPGTEG
ncbi:MAG: hypothetical protein U0167_08505 [bacterium]